MQKDKTFHQNSKRKKRFFKKYSIIAYSDGKILIANSKDMAE